MLAITTRGICHLAFVHPVSRREAMARLNAEWPAAELVPDQDGTRRVAAHVFPAPGSARSALALHVKGTNFQLKVWAALLDVADGRVTTYGALAAAIGSPAAGTTFNLMQGATFDVNGAGGSAAPYTGATNLNTLSIGALSVTSPAPF